MNKTISYRSSHLESIEILALNAIDSIACNEPPVPLEKILEKLGLRVVEFDFPNKISGVLKKQKKVIGINKNHPPLRKRFSTAHELGHYLLGHEIDNNHEEVVDQTFDRPIPQEKEANIFAADILMPKEWVKKYVSGDGLDIPKLARLFIVSEQSMTIRLLELKLIK